MKFKNCFKGHEKLKKLLSDDLVYSFVYDQGQYLLAVSAHNSKSLKFRHGRKMQTCMLTEEDLNAPMDVIIKKIKALYDTIIEEKTIDLADDLVETEIDATVSNILKSTANVA